MNGMDTIFFFFFKTFKLFSLTLCLDLIMLFNEVINECNKILLKSKAFVVPNKIKQYSFDGSCYNLGAA